MRFGRPDPIEVNGEAVHQRDCDECEGTGKCVHFRECGCEERVEHCRHCDGVGEIIDALCDCLECGSLREDIEEAVKDRALVERLQGRADDATARWEGK